MPHSAHPALLLSLALSSNLLVIAFSDPLVSITVTLAALLVALLVGGLQTAGRVLSATLILAAPVAISSVLVHGPFGVQPLAGFVTADGLARALNLTLRLIAACAALLTATTALPVSHLISGLQQVRCPAPLTYVLGATVQLLPAAKQQLIQLREVCQLSQIPTRRPDQALRNLGIPLIARLLGSGLERTVVLQQTKCLTPGRRTLLRPLPYPRWQQAVTIIAPVIAVAATLARIVGVL